MAAHTEAEVLAAAEPEYPQAAHASQVYPDSDLKWWVTDVDYNTFALAWYDELDAFNIRPYKP